MESLDDTKHLSSSCQTCLGDTSLLAVSAGRFAPDFARNTPGLVRVDHALSQANAPERVERRQLKEQGLPPHQPLAVPPDPLNALRIL